LGLICPCEGSGQGLANFDSELNHDLATLPSSTTSKLARSENQPNPGCSLVYKKEEMERKMEKRKRKKQIQHPKP